MSGRDWARPRVVVSRCLGFEPCRWNGEVVNDEFVERLGGWVDYVPVCPEKDSGLGVPRDPVRLVQGPGGPVLIQPATGKDWTGAMGSFMEGFLGPLEPPDGFLLKSRSPSCGPRDVKLYSGPQPGAGSRRGRGMFADRAMELFPGAAFEHEGRVKNLRLREHFLTKIFTLARFRQTLAQGDMGGLIAFHSANKLLLMAYNQDRMRRLGRIVANPQGLRPDRVLAAYQENLVPALAKAPRSTADINVLMHGLGYFKKLLSPGEKAHFLDTMELFRQGRVLLGTLQALLFSWALRHGREYLLGQTYFRPYPLELMDLADSGKGRGAD